MALSPGLIAKGGPKVCKLLKSFYDLKQASRQWFFKLSNALIAYGFGQENSYFSLFIKASNYIFYYLASLCGWCDIGQWYYSRNSKVKSLFTWQVHIKDLGQLKYFIGLGVARSKTCISLYQRKYALDILEDTSFTRSKPLAFPMEYSLKLSVTDTNLYEDPSGYRRLIGRLL